MRNRKLFIFLVVFALAACGQDKAAEQSQKAPTQDPTQADAAPASAADQVLEAYRVRGMLEQVTPIIEDALLANLPAAVDEQQRQTLGQAVAQVYDADKLLQQVSRNLADAAERESHADYLTEAARALDSDLTRRMVKLDDAAATDEFATAFAEFLDQPVADGSDARMQIMQALVDDMQLVELQSVFNIGMMRGMIAARDAAAPEAYTMSQENADKMIRQTREGLHKHLSEQLPVMLFFAYREVEPEKLREYAEMQDSAALRWANQAVVAAMARAFADAAQQVPEQYAALLAQDSA